MLRHRLKDPEPVVAPAPIVKVRTEPQGSTPQWVFDLIAFLCETYPTTFFLHERKRVPLKVGIRDDLIKAIGPDIDPALLRESLGAALRFYAGNNHYLDKIRTGAARIDLDGKECGCVDAKQAHHAATLLKARKKKREKTLDVSAARQSNV